VAGTSGGGDTEVVVTCAAGAAQPVPNAAQARIAHRLIAPSLFTKRSAEAVVAALA
jgi:hypothetical protein